MFRLVSSQLRARNNTYVFSQISEQAFNISTINSLVKASLLFLTTFGRPIFILNFFWIHVNIENSKRFLTVSTQFLILGEENVPLLTRKLAYPVVHHIHLLGVS